MSYEYKEKIKEDLEYSLEGVSIDYYSSEELIHKQKVKELDNVYAQAAKADEYEAKAKAFDNLVDVAYWHFERIHPDDDNRLQYESFYDDIRDEFKKLESGESDELRE